MIYLGEDWRRDNADARCSIANVHRNTRTSTSPNWQKPRFFGPLRRIVHWVEFRRRYSSHELYIRSTWPGVNSSRQSSIEYSTNLKVSTNPIRATLLIGVTYYSYESNHFLETRDSYPFQRHKKEKMSSEQACHRPGHHRLHN